ncbi:MAG: flagellar hook protein FlgE [Rhodothermales bacterium]|nr:flagellar hook protein FlgE [Rhodothermales bacterium]MBO6780451.1 flagellar hook protein FlgE [Rhodothermales bacterium]
MISSLRTGVSGLKTHQTKMDVTGNNIANVNTIGFKRSRTAFTDVLGQRMLGTNRSSRGAAVNTSFVGFGVAVSSIDRNWNQGALENTNYATDLALNGDGFFIVSNGEREMLTRNGRFEFNEDGLLVNKAGLTVQGFQIDANGNVDQSALVDLSINWASSSNASATQEVMTGGNLSADAAVGDQVNISTVIYDDQGTAHTALITYEKTADDTWSYDISYGGSLTPAAFASTTGTLDFDTDGELISNTPIDVTWDSEYTDSNTTFQINIENITQNSGNDTAIVRSQDGYQSGKLVGYSIAPDGMMSLNYSNGEAENIYQLAVASVNNPNGLDNVGDGLYGTTAASGNMITGRAGNEVETGVVAGALEMSNVDLATEFTDMIVAQRGYQAGARVITTSDEILQETVNLKR